MNDFLLLLDGYLGSSGWFVYVLLGTGLFFTLYLGFPQIRYFGHSFRVLRGKFDKEGDEGDTTHFQALATALSGTVGTGNIAGVALAIHLGGPSALFWMLVTAMLGMTTKFVEVTLSHKYREKTADGTMAGGPMYYMKHRMNLKIGKKGLVRTGYWLGSFFAFATILSAFGTGNLPQINSIANALHTSFGIEGFITGAVLAIILALVIIGGIKRIARVTSRLVPIMAIFYFFGALSVLIVNYQQIIPSLISVFSGVFSGTAATGGFLGAGFIYAFNRGVNRGLFSNEAGQGSAPIAHASAKAHEPVSEGMVAILEPFIDTIIICFLTGITILSSGVWQEKVPNRFQLTDLEVLTGVYSDNNAEHRQTLFLHLNGEEKIAGYNGELVVSNGRLPNGLTLLHARSVAEGALFYTQPGALFDGTIGVKGGKISALPAGAYISGHSLIHSAPLTTTAFNKGGFGSYGQYIVAIGILLFAFSTAISWSYYGDRAVIYLWGPGYIIYYRAVYILGFFVASIVDTTIIWSLSAITIVLMTLPNLMGLIILHREVKATVRDYWDEFGRENAPKK